MTTATYSCPQCGAASAADQPCPGCLLNLGLEYPDQETMPPTQDQRDGSDARFETAEVIESQFPGLKIQGLLGKGGMGMVFRASQTSLDRDVALKIIPRKSHDPYGFEARFSREAKALASLNHPNIVTVHDFGKTDDYFFLIMEYVEGVNLRDLLRESRITSREALEIIPQICEALQFAHDRGIVHRDIKPENILLDKSGRVKIADYGLAKLLNEDNGQSGLTQTHHVMGTPHYMAPEQVEKPLSVDHRADIYSLGVVIYEMLTGELPLGRFDPPSRKAKVDTRLDQIVLQSLEKEPDRRYQKVDQVSTDFQSLRQGYTGAAPNPYGEVDTESIPAWKQKNVGDQKPVAPASPPLTEVPPQKPFANDNPYGANPEGQTVLLGLLSTQTFLNAIFLLTSFPLGLTYFLVAVIGLSVGFPLIIIWVGFGILFGTLMLLRIMLRVERTLVYRLLGERLPQRRPMNYRRQGTLWQRLMHVLFSGTTWWGILYSLLKFPLSVVNFSLTLTFLILPLALFAAPFLFSQWWFQIQIDSFHIDSMGKAILACLIGIPFLFLGLLVTNALAWVNKKLARWFLV